MFLKVSFTDPAYLQQVVAFEGRVCEINVFFQSNGDVFCMHICDGPETCTFHCKNVCFFRVLVIMRPIYYKFLVKYDALSTHRNNEKTGVF